MPDVRCPELRKAALHDSCTLTLVLFVVALSEGRRYVGDVKSLLMMTT